MMPEPVHGLLGHSPFPPIADYGFLSDCEVTTAHHWEHWLARGKFPDHPWRAYLERSALTLKG
jgi:hypothetical protein